LISFKPSQIDSLIKQLAELEKNLINDKNYAFEFYGQKGKSALVQFLSDWKETNDVKSWLAFDFVFK
jgi:hypothetical protein